MAYTDATDYPCNKYEMYLYTSICFNIFTYLYIYIYIHIIYRYVHYIYIMCIYKYAYIYIYILIYIIYRYIDIYTLMNPIAEYGHELRVSRSWS